MRLDKAVALTGCSRTQAKEMIQKGRVMVRGSVVRDASMSVELADIMLDNVPLDAEREMYIMINKPAGVVTATEDKHFPTVVSLLPESMRRRGLGPIGRLDKDVTGLVLLTTDGQLAHRLISPRWKAEKRYRATCVGRLMQVDIDAFANGVELSDFTARPAKMEILSSGETSLADVTLTEGKFHQVKRMFDRIGHPLTKLMRLSIGCVTIDNALGAGEYRKLTKDEIEGLKRLTSLNS